MKPLPVPDWVTIVTTLGLAWAYTLVSDVSRLSVTVCWSSELIGTTLAWSWASRVSTSKSTWDTRAFVSTVAAGVAGLAAVPQAEAVKAAASSTAKTLDLTEVFMFISFFSTNYRTVTRIVRSYLESDWMR